jgi:hypothetical protein
MWFGVFMKMLVYRGTVCFMFMLASVAIAAEPVVPKLSIRAMQCQPYEYAELNAMPRRELEGAFCGYVAGFDALKKQVDLSREQYQEQPGVLAALRGDFIQQSQRCTQGIEKTADLLSRKFSATVPDCTASLADLEEARRASIDHRPASSR